MIFDSTGALIVLHHRRIFHVYRYVLRAPTMSSRLSQDSNYRYHLVNPPLSKTEGEGKAQTGSNGGRGEIDTDDTCSSSSQVTLCIKLSQGQECRVVLGLTITPIYYLITNIYSTMSALLIIFVELRLWIAVLASLWLWRDMIAL